MFKSKEIKSTKPADVMNHSHNSLVKGTIVEGKVRSQSDIRIDGSIKGSLDCKAKVVVGTSGYVEGKITCKNAVIMGRVEGNITVTETLKLEESARVKGEITTNKFIVAPGANFNGTCNMGKQDTNVSLKPRTTGNQQNVKPLQKEAI